MDVKRIGVFLSQLRRENNLTQEKLGEQLGVTNKTISRWENGNYLPPVEMLQELSMLYGISINELLSGERLSDADYRMKAELNIADAMESRSFSLRERFLTCGYWIQDHWPWLLLDLLVLWLLFELFDYTYGGIGKAAVLLCLFVMNHILAYMSNKAYEMTRDMREYRLLRMIGNIYAAAKFVWIYLCVDLLLHTLFLNLPAVEYKVDYRYYGMIGNLMLGGGAEDPYQVFALFARALWDLLHIHLLDWNVRFLMKKK